MDCQIIAKKGTNTNLLVVGPLPPPIGGSTQTVNDLLKELSIQYPFINVRLINTSPALDPRKKMTGFNIEKVKRLIMIISEYLLEIRKSIAVLVFANNLFATTTVPVLLLLAKIFRKNFYIKPVGGDLDLYIAAQNKFVRNYILLVLRSADGLLVQTQLLKNSLSRNGCVNTHYIPGFRSSPQKPKRKLLANNAIRIIFLAHITREKGSLILLEAMRLLYQSGFDNIFCDFFGPVHNDIQDEFFQLLDTIPNARYCGITEIGFGSSLISEYEILILPTYFNCEGHPGVIIEAMHVGVPVISTYHRAIPELVTNGKNGLLVPIKDSRALARAIYQIAQNDSLRVSMGKENYRKGQEFRSDVVVAKLVKIIFPT